MKNPNYFIDPDAFLMALESWIIKGRPFSDQDELCSFYYTLAERTVSAYGRGHIDPLDLIQPCVLECCKRSKYFKPERGSPFNFFTRIIKNQITVEYNKENSKYNPYIHVSIHEPQVENYAYMDQHADEPHPSQLTSAEPVREQITTTKVVSPFDLLVTGELYDIENPPRC